MTLVVDASVVVAALVDGGETGQWAERVLLSDHVAAPHLMPVEAANILRRSAQGDEISPDSASLAHTDLQDLRIDLYPYAAVAPRAWELRENLTLHDGWYVALAEGTGRPARNAGQADSPGRQGRGAGLWFLRSRASLRLEDFRIHAERDRNSCRWHPSRLPTCARVSRRRSQPNTGR